MKKCKTCRLEKNFSEFYTNGKTPKGSQKYHPDCKDCELDNNAQSRSRKVEALQAIHGSSCTICGYNKCWEAMDFHHIDPAEKDTTVANLLRNGSKLEHIVREAAKCVLVCANCHREIHAGM